MRPMTSRRTFLQQLGGAALALPLGCHRASPSARAGRIDVGCAAITWGGDDDRAIDDIAALGFRGIQLRANAAARFRDRPAELRERLASRGLTFVALSSGNVPLDAPESEVIAQHVANARFLRDAGGLYLQLIDQPARGRPREAADYARMGRLVAEIGRRVADVGVTAAYHHHMGSLGERPEETERVLDAADPRHVRLLLDVAHWRAAGGDPAAAVRRYADRLLFLHIKDVRIPGPDGRPYQFVELGRGVVDLPAVFAALRDVRFTGWAIQELDAVPEPGRTPKEANEAGRRYLEQVMGA